MLTPWPRSSATSAPYNMSHAPVLLKESIDALMVEPFGTYVDATFGGGGHSTAICQASANTARIVAFDADPQAVDRADQPEFRLGMKCHFELVHANYGDMGRELDKRGLHFIDGALFDLGTSSFQIGPSGKGFSFQHDEPLDMRFGLGSSIDGALADITARDIVNDFGEESIADIIYGFGEERYSRRIAKGIVEARYKAPIETTGQLAKIIEASVPAVYRHSRIHPATRTFQALRLAVNNELENVRVGVTEAWSRISQGGRLAVISFHSLEDRIIKRLFAGWAKDGLGTLVVKKPVVPSEEEARRNPRSRSAKLRIIQKS
jgi:16S rRNA (cytosine1402-N4)-methyltransferase